MQPIDVAAAQKQVDDVDRELTARRASVPQNVSIKDYVEPDPQMLIFLQTIRPKLSDPHKLACMFKLKGVGLREMGTKMKRDGSHRWLVELGLAGVDHFEDRRGILRALRQRYEKERVEEITKKYGIKQKTQVDDTDKTAKLKLTKEFCRVPTTILRGYSTIFRNIGNEQGNIDATRLATALHLTDVDAKKMIDDVDIDGDGHIDFVEFVKVMKSLEAESESDSDTETTTNLELRKDIPESVMRRYKAVFESLDTQKKGLITPNDLSEVMGISLDEAVAMVTSTPRSARGGKNLEGIDFRGFVSLLHEQEDRERQRMDELNRNVSNHDAQSDDEDDDIAVAGRDIFATLALKCGAADDATLPVNVVLSWVDDTLKGNGVGQADAMRVRFGVQEVLAHCGGVTEEVVFDVLDAFPELMPGFAP